MDEDRLNYAKAGVNYTPVDHLKRLASEYAQSTEQVVSRFGFSVIPESRGESAFLINMGSFIGAVVAEGLGTKNIVADKKKGKPSTEETDSNKPQSYYEVAAWDTVACIANDLITVGAQPVVICPHWAAGSSDWFEDQDRNRELYLGWLKACSFIGAVYGPGETAILPGIINPETIELSGFCFGAIMPPNRETLGQSLAPGDHVVLIESSGIHANGLTLARRIADEFLPKGYEEMLPSGRSYGEALLTPSHLYAPFQRSLFAEGVDVHYMVNITGHGWRKIMRARPPFTYFMHTVPTPQEEFSFMQQKVNISDYEMWSTFNMGTGYGVIVPENHARGVIEIAQKHQFQAWDAGVLEKGPKQVIIEPKKVVFKEESLQIR
jgi:phosphoribosylformylglycinamidine cyclo-ligase